MYKYQARYDKVGICDHIGKYKLTFNTNQKKAKYR